MSFFLRDGGRKTTVSLSRRKRAFANEEIASESESDLSGDEGAEGSMGEDSEDQEESAQAKRHRLAKDLLNKVQTEVGQRDEQVELEERDDGRVQQSIERDDVAQRLKEEALEKLGRLHRKVADTVSIASEPDEFVKIRGHRYSLTALALTSDGHYAVTAAKDGSVIKYDLKLGVRLTVLKLDKVPDYHKGAVMAVAISENQKYLVTGGMNGVIKIWDFASMTFVRDLTGHKKLITGLAFRKNALQLFSSSRDRSVKAWDLDAMGYVDTMFGHQDAVVSLDCLSRERAVSCGGQDRSVRVWKVADESQLVFNGIQNCCSIDCVRLINEDHFISGGMDGSLCVWSLFKKRPTVYRKLAHGGDVIESNWIVSVAANRYTDLVASGSRDGYVRLWKVGVDYKSLNAVGEIKMVGFINDMVFTDDGSKLVCAVGQEHKNGRWWKETKAHNAIVIVPLKYEIV